MVQAAAAVLEPEVNNKRIKRSDDVSSLQTLVEQQASLIQTLQASLAAQENRISSLENSLQTLRDTVSHDVQLLENKIEAKTKTVAFSARIAAVHDSGDAGLVLGEHQIVVFDETITSVGNAYNNNTGIFTAPVSGTYAFFLSQMSVNNHHDLLLVIAKNGATLDMVFAQSQGDVYEQGSSQVTTHLTSGDQIWVRQERGEGVRADWWTIFTGYLLQAD